MTTPRAACYSFLVAVAPMLGIEALGQNIVDFDTLRSVSVSTPKTSYQLFEAVEIDVDVTNNSSRLQFFGPPAERGRSFYYLIVGPHGDTLRGHEMYYRDSSHPTPLYVSYHPGQTKSGKILLNLAASLWDATGTYSFLAYALDPDPPVTYVLASSTTFEVNELTGVSAELIDTLKYAAKGIFAYDSGPSVEGAIQFLLAQGSVPGHVTEFVRYLNAASAEVKWRSSGTGLDSVIAAYDDFNEEYPESSWGLATASGLVGMVHTTASFHSSDLEAVRSLVRFRVLLEGVVVAGTDSMAAPVISQIRPVLQPFGEGLHSNPRLWIENYADPTLDIDWANIILVDTTSNPDSMVAKAAGLILSDGWGTTSFYDIPRGEYHVIVDHRNHLAIASDTLVDFSTGFAQHDFTTGHAYGNNAQETIISGPDTVYAMFAGDANADGQVTATDFNFWLTDTKSAAGGYINTDFQMDGSVTATDYNYWLNNTKKAPASPYFVRVVLDSGLDSNAPWAGGGSEALPKTAITEDDIRVRYRLTGSSANGFVNTYIDFKQDTGGSEVDTLGSATFDVYYNSDQLSLDFASHYVDLLEAGYTVKIAEGVNEHGSFKRVDIYTWNPDTVSYDVRSDWENGVIRLNFDATGSQITDHGLGMNLATMRIFLVSNAEYREASALVPWWADGGFTY